MFLHLARASVSQYSITVGQRQATGQAGHRHAGDPSTYLCCTGGEPAPASKRGGTWSLGKVGGAHRGRKTRLPPRRVKESPGEGAASWPGILEVKEQQMPISGSPAAPATFCHSF